MVEDTIHNHDHDNVPKLEQLQDYFDEVFYRDAYEDLTDYTGDLFLHYVNQGRLESRLTCKKNVSSFVSFFRYPHL